MCSFTEIASPLFKFRRLAELGRGRGVMVGAAEVWCGRCDPKGSGEMKAFYFVNEASPLLRFRRMTELGRGRGVMVGAAEVFVEDATPRGRGK